MSKIPSSKRVIYAALLGNLLVAATKFAAAAWTGSSAMLSEGAHSVADTTNEVLLLYGMRQAGRPPDPSHPLGYGRELYFWSFIVALLIFTIGAGVSFYEGIVQIRSPEPIEYAYISYIVLALSAVFEGISWYFAFRKFKATKGHLSYFQTFRKSKDPLAFTVLFEDTAALIGLLFAFIGTMATVTFEMPVFDGAASILISVLLALAAALLARECKDLLLGEHADPEVVEAIRRLVGDTEGVSRVNGVLTVHLAPDQVVAMLSIEFADDLRTSDIEQKVIVLEDAIRSAHPEITAVFVKPQTAAVFEAAKANRLAGASL